MVEARILMWMSSQWGACIKFPSKKKGSAELRVVYNYIPVNQWSYPSAYLIHSMDEVLDLIIKSQYKVYFTGDASWSYWAIPIKLGDEHKTGIMTPHRQYVYYWMGMGLWGSMFSYSQFADLVFGPIPAGDNSVALPSLIRDHQIVGFYPFVDDHNTRANTFKDMFTFLHEKYFPHLIFSPVYLIGCKLFTFTTSLEAIGFQGGLDGIQLSVKHQDYVLDWLMPSNCVELNTFI